MVTAIHDATGGNPFFIDAVTRLLVAEGRWKEQIRIPEGVRDAIRGRLEPLADSLKLLLAMAAVIGKDVDATLLEAMVGTPMTPAIRDLLAEAVAFGLLRETPERDCFTFTHALIRDVLRDDLPVTRRMQLHWMAGTALETLHRSDLQSHLDELAYHFFHAAPLGTADKAIDYCVRAGQRALEQCAYAESVSYYEHALDALRFIETDELQRCNLLLGLGEAQRRARTPGAGRDTFMRAAAIAQQSDGPYRGRILAEAGLGLGRDGETGNIDQPMIELLEESVGILDERDCDLRARVLGRLATGLYYSPERARRQVLAKQAMAEARSLARRTRSSQRSAQLLVTWEPGQHAQHLAICEDLTRVAEAAGNQKMALEGRLWHAVQQLEARSGRGVSPGVGAVRRARRAFADAGASG